jgi:plasmid stabilization system protein ParE
MPALMWLPEALEDVERLYGFLTEKNPQATKDAVLCIQAAAIRLERFPELGAPMVTVVVAGRCSRLLARGIMCCATNLTIKATRSSFGYGITGK